MDNKSENNFIANMLAKKDEVDETKVVPPAYNMTRDQARFQLFAGVAEVDYTMARIAHCMGPCFTNMNSPVVSQNESDCMTNCIGKSVETLALFRLNDQRD